MDVVINIGKEELRWYFYQFRLERGIRFIYKRKYLMIQKMQTLAQEIQIKGRTAKAMIKWIISYHIK